MFPLRILCDFDFHATLTSFNSQVGQEYLMSACSLELFSQFPLVTLILPKNCIYQGFAHGLFSTVEAATVSLTTA